MLKINRYYTSMFETLAIKFPAILKWRFVEFLYRDECERFRNTRCFRLRLSEPRGIKGDALFLLGGFQPLAYMGKDFVDTFTPYKSGSHVRRDLLQPLYGLGNIVKGLLNLIFVPLMLLGGMVITLIACTPLVAPEKRLTFVGFLNSIKEKFVFSCALLLDGSFSIVRGIMQIATTPLILFKIPLRGFITFIDTPDDKPIAENDAKIQGLVEKAKDPANSAYLINLIHEIHLKYKKRVKAGQRTSILASSEEEYYQQIIAPKNEANAGPYTADATESIRNYLALFDKNITDHSHQVASHII